MKIIEPSVELLRTGLEKEFMRPEQFIEKVGRTCYKSEDKITDDSAAKFVSNLIKRGHEAMIEHWSLIFTMSGDTMSQIQYDWNTIGIKPHLRFTDYARYVVSGNMRAWRDFANDLLSKFGFIPNYMHGMILNYPMFFPEYQDYVPKYIGGIILKPIDISDLTNRERLVHQDITVKFICDRGVSHELVRHRVASFAQESTRYCNYGDDKFGNEITVIRPSWCGKHSDLYKRWFEGCLSSECAYLTLLAEGATPQQARAVLPNSLKTEVIMTMNLAGWNHFFILRRAKGAHPDMQEVAGMAHELFGEIYGDE